jgi:hypothetical protein
MKDQTPRPMDSITKQTFREGIENFNAFFGSVRDLKRRHWAKSVVVNELSDVWMFVGNHSSDESASFVGHANAIVAVTREMAALHASWTQSLGPLSQEMRIAISAESPDKAKIALSIRVLSLDFLENQLPRLRSNTEKYEELADSFIEFIRSRHPTEDV